MGTDEKELKSCPCCGNEVLLLEDRQLWGNVMLKGWLICCTSCSCGASNLNKKAIVEDWNKRKINEQKNTKRLSPLPDVPNPRRGPVI